MRRSLLVGSAPVLVASLAGAVPLACAAELSLRQDSAAHTIAVHRAGTAPPILTQHARPDFRPYLHPLVAPDGKGVLTEYSPGHHKHQTGLYWGFTRVNGRDYFHNPANDHWRRVAVAPVIAAGKAVRWATVYQLLDAARQPIMLETQTWTLRDFGDRYLLDLEWKGQGLVDVTVARYDYGGLFLRMPWRNGMEGAAVNSQGQRNAKANGQRARWVDVGMKVDGREDLAHIAIFDHPGNGGHPLPWRVDAMMGIGPSRAIAGDWHITKGEVETIRHQFLVYTGTLDARMLTAAWQEYAEDRVRPASP